MTTVKDITDQMIYELTIIQELDELRREEKKTNSFINVIVRDLSCIVINQFLGLTDYDNTNYPDNLTINKNDYKEDELEIIQKERKKYKRFRNKMIAHTTTEEINISTSVKDLIRLISLIRKADVVIHETGCLKYFLRPMLNIENKSEVN